MPETLSPNYDSIYLSPHLDDAVLSCGGQIAERVRSGQRVLVVTVFAGDEPAQPTSEFVGKLHTRFYGMEHGIMRARRIEDQRAIEILGAEHLHWDDLETIYREDATTRVCLYPTLKSVFGEVRPEDTPLVDRLVERLGELPPCDRVVVPLGVGGHVDHQLVRTAAERRFGSSARLLHYEDYPYVARWRALSRILRPRADWSPEVQALSPASLSRKCRAIAAYATQVVALFKSHARLERKVNAYARKVGGERNWRRVAGGA